MNYPYRFHPDACQTCKGRCCNGESGNIWVSREEIQGISDFLNLTCEDFIKNYLRKISYRYSITELKSGDNYACVFFDSIINRCSIYTVRPEQCRTFPFWPYFKTHPREVFEECPGVVPLKQDQD